MPYVEQTDKRSQCARLYFLKSHMLTIDYYFLRHLRVAENHILNMELGDLLIYA